MMIDSTSSADLNGWCSSSSSDWVIDDGDSASQELVSSASSSSFSTSTNAGASSSFSFSFLESSSSSALPCRPPISTTTAPMTIMGASSPTPPALTNFRLGEYTPIQRQRKRRRQSAFTANGGGGAAAAILLILLQSLTTIGETHALTTFDIIWWEPPSTSPTITPALSQQQEGEGPGRIDHQLLMMSPSPSPLPSSSGSSSSSASVFGTRNGYDQPNGKQAICWKTTFANNAHDKAGGAKEGVHTDLLPSCCDQRHAYEQPVLRLEGPIDPLIESDEESDDWLHSVESDDDEDERLFIQKVYEYQVHINLNLTQLFLLEGGIHSGKEQEGDMELMSSPSTQSTGEGEAATATASIAIQILFCRVGQVSFCSPFVPEQVMMAIEDDSDSTATTSTTQRPYFQSDWFHMDVPLHENNDNNNNTNTTTHSGTSRMINEAISIPTVVDQVGSYFVLANLRVVSTTSNHAALPSNTFTLPHYQWDIANGLDPTSPTGRVLHYQSPPEILEVSKGARITSYVAVALASCVLLGLLYQTILHRKNQVLHLSQVGFLILFQVAALLATLSSLLVEPKNDLYCQLSHPMTLIPLQLMYSITIGRLWRINAVISPLLVEHFRKNLRSQRWTGKLVSWVQRQTATAITATSSADSAAAGNSNNSSHCYGGRSRGRRRRKNNTPQLRRTVTSSRLALVISIFAIPQVVVQICAWLIQPQERMIQLNYQTNQGMAMCQPTNIPDDFPMVGNILYWAYGILILLLLLLLIMAYSCRNLPSLFNETHVIYTIIFRTFLFVVFGAVLVIVLQTQQEHIAPDIVYLLWMTIILYTTLASSLGLLLPKLQMIWKGEVVIVSKLVSDHHRARREKKHQEEQRKSNKHSGMENVTGIDLSQSGHSHSNSYSMAGSSFNTEAYLMNGSLTGSFTSYTAGGGYGGGESYMDGSLHSRGEDRPILPPGGGGTASDVNKKDPHLSKLSDLRRSGTSTISLPLTSAATESTYSNSFNLPIASEDVTGDDDYENDGDEFYEDDDRNVVYSSIDEEAQTTATRVTARRGSTSGLGEWKSQMKSFRDKWTRSSFLVGGGTTDNNNATSNQSRSRPSSEILPTASTTSGVMDEDFEEIDLNSGPDSTAATATTIKDIFPDHTRRRGGGKNHQLQPQRSAKKRRPHMLVVSPDETPPRRLVMKMVNQQDCLNSITTKIMSGLSVRPDEWDKLVRLHTILEKCLQEEVSFTWKKEQQPPPPPPPPPPQPRRRSYKQPPQTPPPQQIERISSTNSLHLEDIENFGSRNNNNNDETNKVQPKIVDNNDMDQRSAGGDSRDATLRRSNQQPRGSYKSFAKLSHVAREFRRVVDCRDRQYMFTTYKNCFIGSDAIDSLIYAGLVASREEAVELGRRLAEELHLFKHVTGDHDFKDERYFYEFYSDSDSDCSTSHEDEDEEDNKSIQLFDIHENTAQSEARAFRDAIDVRDRRYHLKLYPKVFVGCEAVDALIYHGVAKTRWEAVQLGRRLARETKLFRHVCGDHELRDEWLFYRFSDLDEHGVESSLGSALSDVGRPKSEIAELADAFEMYVDIRDRWYHAKKYKMCFIGSEAVDAMIYAGLVTTREEAVALGRRLEKELRLFHHVCNDHEFKDEMLFYELRRRGTKLGGSSRSGGRSGPSNPLLDDSGSDHLGNSMGGSKSSSSQGEKHTKFSNIRDKAALFRQCAVITTGTWRMKKYPNVFIGSDTVDRMVYTGLAENRLEAVQLARALARELKLFRHVANDHAFCDDYLFYRFRSEDDSSSAGSISTFSKTSQIVSPPRNIQTVGGDLSESQQSQSQSPSVNNNSFSSSITGRSALAEKAEIFRNLAKVKDRKYRLRTYSSCFVGEQVVDALVEAGVVETREAAVKYGKELQSQLRLFQHVVGAHSFEDSYLFYRFRDLGFREGVDMLGTSLNSVNELSVSSTIGGDYTRSEPDNDVREVLGGSGAMGGGRFGLPVLDENSELDAACTIPTTRRERMDRADLGESSNIPALMEYEDVDAVKPPEPTEDDSSNVQSSSTNDEGKSEMDTQSTTTTNQVSTPDETITGFDGDWSTVEVVEEQTSVQVDVAHVADNDDDEEPPSESDDESAATGSLVA